MPFYFNDGILLHSLRTVIKVFRKKDSDPSRDTNYIMARHFYGEFTIIYRVSRWDSLAKEITPLAEKHKGTIAGKTLPAASDVITCPTSKPFPPRVLTQLNVGF